MFSHSWLFSHTTRFHILPLPFSLFKVIVFIFHGRCFHVSGSKFSRFAWQQEAMSFNVSHFVFTCLQHDNHEIGLIVKNVRMSSKWIQCKVRKLFSSHICCRKCCQIKSVLWCEHNIDPHESFWWFAIFVHCVANFNDVSQFLLMA